jgi:hypothetical protein
MNLIKRIQDYLRTPITPELLEQWEKDIRLEEMDNMLKEDMRKLEEALIKKDKL